MSQLATKKLSKLDKKNKKGSETMGNFFSRFCQECGCDVCCDSCQSCDYLDAFVEYQNMAAKTAIYPPEHKVLYPMIGLANEAGEALGKLKKVLRGDKPLEEQKDAIIDELGDVLWYLANVAKDLGVSLSEVAQRNIEKLAARKEAGTLRGDGDKR